MSDPNVYSGKAGVVNGAMARELEQERERNRLLQAKISLLEAEKSQVGHAVKALTSKVDALQAAYGAGRSSAAP